jgi:PEP-CTERM motif
MSKMRKSLAVLSSAIAPILLAGSSASAGVNLNLVTTLPTEWPNSTIGAIPVVDSGTSTATIPGGPTNSTPSSAETFSPGVILSETFTTPNTSSFQLGAISLVAGGGGPTDTTLGASIHLFQLNSQYTPTSGFYTLGNGGSEVGNDLLGGGAGLAFNLHASNNAIYEFDFNNTTTSDQVTMLPNTQYAIEIWSSSDNAPTTFFQRTNGQSYTGGQAYAITDASQIAATQVDHSTVFRGQATGNPINMLFAVYSNSVVIPGPSFWNVTSSGNWNVASNWSSLSVPSGIGAEADFLSPTSTVNGVPPTKNGLSANGNVFTDTAQTVGIMNFDNSHTYVLDGAGSLTIQVATGNGQVNVLSGTQEINLPLTIASNTVFNVAASSELLIANPVTVNTGMSLTSTGTGSVVYQSLITLQSGASLAIPNSTFANTLSLTTGSTATLTAHGTNSKSLLQLDTLSLGGSSGNWLGKVNLANNDMVVHGGSLATVTSQIAQGRNSGTTPWTGSNGITSTSAAASPTTTALGVEVNDNGHGVALMTSFDGQPVADGDILVKYTYVGDADLTGSINASDYMQIDNGFANHLTGWHNGDFNYDGVVNGDDYTLIDNAFNTQGANIAGISAGPAESIASPAAVPEPASLGLLGISAAAMFTRRRRRA